MLNNLHQSASVCLVQRRKLESPEALRAPSPNKPKMQSPCQPQCKIFWTQMCNNRKRAKNAYQKRKAKKSEAIHLEVRICFHLVQHFVPRDENGAKSIHFVTEVHNECRDPISMDLQSCDQFARTILLEMEQQEQQRHDWIMNYTHSANKFATTLPIVTSLTKLQDLAWPKVGCNSNLVTSWGPQCAKGLDRHGSQSLDGTCGSTSLHGLPLSWPVLIWLHDIPKKRGQSISAECSC